jgi:hypothetical protein
VDHPLEQVCRDALDPRVVLAECPDPDEEAGNRVPGDVSDIAADYLGSHIGGAKFRGDWSGVGDGDRQAGAFRNSSMENCTGGGILRITKSLGFLPYTLQATCFLRLTNASDHCPVRRRGLVSRE